jgi:hypothetical protein
MVGHSGMGKYKQEDRGPGQPGIKQISKNNQSKRTGRVAQVTEHYLASKHEPNSILSDTKKIYRHIDLWIP